MLMKHKFMLAEVFLILASAYAVEGYSAASMYVAGCTFLYTLYVTGADTLKKDGFILTLIGILEGMILHFAGVHEQLPALACTSVITLICADMWMNKAAGKLRAPMSLTVKAFAALLLLTVIMPDTALGFAGTLCVVFNLFMPFLFFYVICRVSDVQQKRIPAMKIQKS